MLPFNLIAGCAAQIFDLTGEVAEGDLATPDCQSRSICLMTRTLQCFMNRGSTCTNRTLPMREWLTDSLSDVIGFGGIGHPLLLSF